MGALDNSEVRATGRDPAVEAYKRDIDRSLLRENLRLTPEERIRKLSDFVEFLNGVRRSSTKQL